MSAANSYTIEWHPTPQLWVAYRGCGCSECPKGLGKTRYEAIVHLEDQLQEPSSATVGGADAV